jgi:hypothetical protein
MGFKVGDQYRTNEMSLRPGGETVVVTYNDGRVYEYDKVKNPYAYIRKIEKNPLVKSASIKV